MRRLKSKFDAIDVRSTSEMRRPRSLRELLSAPERDAPPIAQLVQAAFDGKPITASAVSREKKRAGLTRGVACLRG